MPQIQDQAAEPPGGYTGMKWSCPSPGVWCRRHDSPRINKFNPERAPDIGCPNTEHFSGHRTTTVRSADGSEQEFIDQDYR
eukprot:7775819-Alexandrium_andersonii.AAC.1